MASILFVCLVLSCSWLLSLAIPSAAAVTTQSSVLLYQEYNQVIISNGIVQLTISKPQGCITGIRYNGIDNLLQHSYRQSNLGGYWDLVWNFPGSGQRGFFEILEGAEFKVVVQNEDQVEVSFSSLWNPWPGNGVRLNIDIRYIVLRGSSGFYSYAILEHQRGWPGLDISEIRIAFKLREDKFRHMAVSDNRRRKMPRAEDREYPRAVTLAYKEAVRIVNPLEPEFRGEVDDKYQYTVANKDSRVHGWICSDPPTPTGFWVITPSNEFRAGGPLKQELTSHVGPTSLAIFLSDHYTGRDAHFRLDDGEYWKKVFGPVFIYLNSAANQRDVALHLWEDAKAQMQIETRTWPYNFPASVDFPKMPQRGSLISKLMVRDGYISKYDGPAKWAYIGLALPGEPGSWQREIKGYQFWTRSNSRGEFVIKNIRPGDYNIYAWVPGFFGDFMHNSTITINPGQIIKLGTLVFEPPRNGPTLWEIGVPDRTAAEFFVPDPKPKYANRLYINHPEKYRQYGLWERYTDLYPTEDLVYRVGVSDYKKDWFFAHVTRKVGNSFHPTTWRIKFRLNFVETSRLYTLRLAVAAAHYSRLQVRVNNPNGEPHFTTPAFGDGNTIARHGILGIQWNFNVKIEGRLLYSGENTIYLTQAKGEYEFNGIMYDYLRLEGP